MFRKRLFISIFFCSLFFNVQQSSAKEQKPVPVRTLLKEARTAIKNKRDQKNREKALLEALKREGLTNAEKAEIYFTAAQLENSLNDAENLKAYLKQKYDTAAYYNTMLTAVRYVLLCDSIDTLLTAKGKVNARFRSKNRDMLLLYRPNIYLGGRFFLRKSDYKSAYDFMSAYTDFQQTPLLKGSGKLLGDTLLANSTYYSVLSAYNCGNPTNALRYLDQAIAYADSVQQPKLQELKVRCLKDLKREEAWYAELKEGLRMFPKHDYFFLTLSDFYEQEERYNDCIALADSMLQNVQDATIYWYSKSLMHLDKEEWRMSIEMADSVLAREPEHVNALYNKAISYINLATEFAPTVCNDIRNPQCQKDRQYLQSLYQEARHPSEEIRRLRPDAVTSWTALLYRVYMNLNLGEELSEIEQIIKELESPEP